MFFAVSAIPAAEKAYDNYSKSEYFRPRVLRFLIKNLPLHGRLLDHGHTPVVLECSKDEFERLSNGQMPWYRQAWKRISGEVDYLKGEEGMEALFHHTLRDKFQPADYVVFAYIYPYSYDDMLLSVKEIETKVSEANEKGAEIYFKSEELT
jgi:hypothetical protein